MNSILLVSYIAVLIYILASLLLQEYFKLKEALVDRLNDKLRGTLDGSGQ